MSMSTLIIHTLTYTQIQTYVFAKRHSQQHRDAVPYHAFTNASMDFHRLEIYIFFVYGASNVPTFHKILHQRDLFLGIHVLWRPISSRFDRFMIEMRHSLRISLKFGNQSFMTSSTKSFRQTASQCPPEIYIHRWATRHISFSCRVCWSIRLRINSEMMQISFEWRMVVHTCGVFFYNDLVSVGFYDRRWNSFRIDWLGFEYAFNGLNGYKEITIEEMVP